MNYQQEMLRHYYSTHYKFFEPKTDDEWNWVINRIDVNFGNIFPIFHMIVWCLMWVVVLAILNITS